ncbi:MAG: chemotaxis protein CheX [Elusimicrobiales bacterium]|nr:chemotaxis protein CheX [Elusimicrobiales bacterium]
MECNMKETFSVKDISYQIDSVVRDIFMTMLANEITSCQEEFNGSVEVSVFLGIGGKKKYTVVIETDEKFAIKVASAMLMEEINEWSEAVSDAFGELANMIAGNIKSKLPSETELSLSLPTVIKGKSYTYSTPKMKEIAKMCFKSFDNQKMLIKLFEEV